MDTNMKARYIVVNNKLPLTISEVSNSIDPFDRDLLDIFKFTQTMYDAVKFDHSEYNSGGIGYEHQSNIGKIILKESRNNRNILPDSEWDKFKKRITLNILSIHEED